MLPEGPLLDADSIVLKIPVSDYSLRGTGEQITGVKSERRYSGCLGAPALVVAKLRVLPPFRTTRS